MGSGLPGRCPVEARTVEETEASEGRAGAPRASGGSRGSLSRGCPEAWAHLSASPSRLAGWGTSTLARPQWLELGEAALLKCGSPQRDTPGFRGVAGCPWPIWASSERQIGLALSPTIGRGSAWRPQGGLRVHMCAPVWHPAPASQTGPLAWETSQHLSSVRNRGPKAGTWVLGAGAELNE